jgi:primosomal protein N' (replication factor Y)
VSEEKFATFVNVIIPVPLQKLYTYRVPIELANQIMAGKRVVVQFGKRKLYAAIVHDIQHHPPAGYEAKYIVSILDDEPLISANTIKFWDWLASYYMCTPGEVMNAALPAAFRLESNTRVMLNPDADLTIELSDKEFLITEALTIQKELSIDQISEITHSKNVFPLLKSLHIKGLLLFIEEITETYKPKIVNCVRLAEVYSNEDALEALFSKLGKNEKQLNVLLAYLQLKQESEHIEKSRLLNRGDISESSLKTLIKNEIMELYPLHIDRLAKEETLQHEFNLNPLQEQCLQNIQHQFKDKDVCLLHGVTSSGKTHIYVKLIEEAISNHQQVLYLLPEIALTSQVISRLKKYFGNRAVAFHSKYNQHERVEIWKKISSGEAQVIIGARSAIFMPFQALGLIIVDEEHEQSYKQQDPSPRYHARDAAIYLAHLWQCKVLLGSATPSFESYYNVNQGRYGLVKLHQRFGEIEMPKLLTADIAEEKRTRTIRGSFTSTLMRAIETALKQNEQVILFQNRRGFAPLYECRKCHWVPTCIHCDISLTYHKYNDILKCHYCGYQQKLPKTCTACQSHELEFKGLGTEKVEDEIKIYFPEARVERLDQDAAKTKHGHEKIIASFEQRDADILVGTQMVSKGLDFEHVSVVGIINADTLLFFPEFRAHERAYQLLTQVSGRAGRKHKQGKVIIQTSLPDHHVVQEVIHQRFDLFYANEMTDRKQFQYPPFQRLIKVVLRHKDYKQVHEAALALRHLLYKRLGDKIIGPESPYVSRIKNLHIKEFLIKIERDSKHLATIKQFIQEQATELLSQKAFNKVYYYCDVDPV